MKYTLTIESDDCADIEKLASVDSCYAALWEFREKYGFATNEENLTKEEFAERLYHEYNQLLRENGIALDRLYI